jgi:nucleoside-diphosphate-sugar epimerase
VTNAGPGIAVVTGGTGFIGWALCESLRDSGWTVRAVVRPSSTNPLPEGVERWDAELDAIQMSAACDAARVVYHLAGLTRARTLDDFLAVNADGAHQAALAAHAAGAFFVFVSSQAAAGPGTPARPRTESDSPAPVSNYGRSKLAGEDAVRSIDGLRAAIIRPPGVYGPRDKDFLVLFSAACRGLAPRLGSAAKAYTLIHVADAVGALCTVADAGLSGRPGVAGETFFIGHPEPVSQGDLLDLVAAAVGRRARRVPVPLVLLRGLAELGELQGMLTGRPAVLNRARYYELAAPGFVCAVDKIAAAIDWRAATGAAAGLEATARWYRAANWL